MKLNSLFCCVAILNVLSGCDLSPSESLSSRADRIQSPIVWGTYEPEILTLSDAQQAAVGALLFVDRRGDWTNSCTGTLITPTTVLTAAHCVEGDADGGTVYPEDVAFAIGADVAEPLESQSPNAVHIHPGYDAWSNTALYDIALLIFDEPFEYAEPLPLNCEPIPYESLLGEFAQNVGYGTTEDRWSANTVRYWSAQEVVTVTDVDFTVDGYGQSGVCSGDSGGPSLLEMEDGVVRIIGNLSWGDARCGNRDYFGRSEAHCPFIRTYVDQDSVDVSEGGCELEGVSFGGGALVAALSFFDSMTCEECTEVLDSRICEDAINDRFECMVGSSCTGCSDNDGRGDGLSCEEIADYSYFGPSAAQALYAHIDMTPTIGGAAVVEAVSFSAQEAAEVLTLVNSASLEFLDVDVNLDSRAASNIVAARPFDDIPSLGAVPYVGESALTTLRDYVIF